MRLTAVVPTTDAAPTLEVALEAIAAADEGPDEVVVVLGGDAVAPDDDGVVVVRSAAHGGPAAARNAGAAAATGEVIVFVDADVAVRGDAFARVRAAFAGREVDAVFGSYCDSPAAGGVVSGFRNLLHHHVHQRGAGRAETFWTGLGAVRRDTLLRAGGLDDELRYLEDIDLDPELQGTHLKGYTLRSMVQTDLRERSIPWLRLALEQRVSARALNAAPRHRASALASVA